jgi:hypothetical protein
MPVFCLPIIGQRDYNTFRRIAHPDFPNTYDEWLKLQAKERDSLTMRGHQVIEVKIEPHEFSDFCRAHTHDSYSQRMTDLAIEKYRWQMGQH